MVYKRNLTVDQCSGANLKNLFFQKFAANFCKFLAFLVFCSENAENDYFDQRLACTAPKRWSLVEIYNNPQSGFWSF